MKILLCISLFFMVFPAGYIFEDYGVPFQIMALISQCLGATASYALHLILSQNNDE